VDWFRHLLTLPPSERERVLAESGKTADQKQVLRAKVLEYEGLPPAERERRLHAVQLRLWITKLMPMTPSQRTERLAAIPEADRPLVVQRLNEWDQLGPVQQQEFLEDQRTVYLVRARPAGSPEPTNQFRNLSLLQRERMEQDLSRLTALPSQRRERLLDTFEKFFELSAREKTKALNGLSEAERTQMEATLQAFEKLPREQRIACIRAFDTLAKMSKTERDRFLQHAELWQAMAPTDRATWRRLVTSLPPMPPGPVPPLPPVTGRTSTQAQTALSGGSP